MAASSSWRDQDDFSVLGTFDLPTRHVLHPGACNPAMDLVALLAPQAGPAPRAPVFPAWHPKGKQKAVEPAGGIRTKVSLWRVSKSIVWEVEMQGQVVGLAWTNDGQHLSLLTLSTSVAPGEPMTSSNAGLTCHHMSVHTGSTVRRIPCSAALDGADPVFRPDSNDVTWWTMYWERTDRHWPHIVSGSALDIIDSLPGPSKVEPLKPPNYDMMMRMNPAAVSPLDTGPHSALSTFPSLLSDNPSLTPDTLCISIHSKKALRLLTGCFPLDGKGDPSDDVLRFARLTNAVSRYLNLILRGLETAEHAFREAEKQTMIWREELETAATQQAMSKEAVYADLLRMLLAGRCDVAVSEWFGGKLTSRAVAKWEVTLEASFRTMRKVITDSVSPALERIILVLEELSGWSQSQAESSGLRLSANAIRTLLDNTADFAILLESIRQEANHDLLASLEFIKWLKYEIHRAAHQDVTPESTALMSYDIKLAWAYLKTGFVVSPLTRYFPPRYATPSYDLAIDQGASRPSQSPVDLDDALARSLAILRHPGSGKAARVQSDATATPDAQDMSAQSSMALTSQGQSSPSQQDEELPSRAESPDSADTMPIEAQQASEPIFHKEDWAWYWADLLRDRLEKLALGASSSDTASVSASDEESQQTITSAASAARVLQTGRLFVRCSREAPPALEIKYGSQTIGPIEIGGLSDTSRIVALQFFDDTEFAVLVVERSETTKASVYLVTVPVEQLLAAEAGSKMGIARSTMLQHGEISGESTASMALNGRAGRRLGFFLLPKGKTIVALDMEVEDDAEDDDEDPDAAIDGEVDEEDHMDGMEGS